jgi:general secretion pathway protein L
VILPATKFAVVLQGNRLVGAAIRGDRVETFVVEAEQPAVALRAELDARKLTPRRVAVGLSRSTVTVKPIDLPAVDGAVRDILRFELERHLPFPADDAPFDFVPLPARGDGKTAGSEGRRVLVAAAEKRLVDAALRIMDEAHLRPVSVTVASHDLLGLVTLDRKSRVAWVHRTGRSADLLFIADGVLILSRAVSAADEPGIAEEIKRSLGMLRWKTCDAIWVSGDIDAADVVQESALSALAARVSEPPYTRRARTLRERNQQNIGGAADLAIAVAAGRRVRPFDLIPESRRPRRITRGQMVTAGTLAATVVLGLVALLYPGQRTARYLDTLNKEIAQLAPAVRDTERVLQELERKRRLLATIETAQSTALQPLPVLRELTDLVPADAWVSALSLDTKGVEVTGQAASASTLIPVLENSPRFERVEFSSPVTRGRDKEQFRIRAVWEGGPGARPPATAAAVNEAGPRPPAPPSASPPTAGPARPRVTMPADDTGDEEETPPARQPRRPTPPNPRPAGGPR